MKHLWWLVIVSPGGWCEARQAETVDWRRPEIILIIEKWRKPTRGVYLAHLSHPGHYWVFLKQTIWFEYL